ncbi:MAG: hypothetical protein JWM74_3211, partial [Myxococcaceae bacterium]|nr:hypothetical protein [Myxococcaceae bacterium]
VTVTGTWRAGDGRGEIGEREREMEMEMEMEISPCPLCPFSPLSP